MAYSHQKRIEPHGRLLDDRGRLTQCGFSDSPALGYDRSDVPFLRRLRLKEWDSYCFGNDEWHISLSIADNGYMGIVSATVVNLREGWHRTNTSTELFTFGRYELPNTSVFGDIVHRSKNSSVNITLGQNERRLTLRFPNFDDVKELFISAVFHEQKEDSLWAVIPFGNKKEFFCTHKINCMNVSATMRYAGLETRFEPDSTFGGYEWCRGVFPSNTQRIHCCADDLHEGERFGFNFGTGFGNRRECGENAFFYKGKMYKIGELDITVPSDLYRESWSFIGEDGDINLRMVPVYSLCEGCSALGFVKINQNRVFGRYFGTVMLRNEDGSTERLVLDGVSGFSEAVDCRW